MTYNTTWIANAKMWYLYILYLVAHLRVLLFVLYIVVTFLYMPFMPVYKGFIWIIQCYRSVSPSDFHRALLSSYSFRAFGCRYMSLLPLILFNHFDINHLNMLWCKKENFIRSIYWTQYLKYLRPFFLLLLLEFLHS